MELDGTDALTRPAPADVLLTWSADEAVACTGTGTEWSGPQHTTGSVRLADLLPGPHAVTLTCAGPTGVMAEDTARIDVTP